MLNKFLVRLALAVGLFGGAGLAQAVTCENGDWLDAVCNYTALSGTRCWTDPVAAGNFAAQCAPSTDGCANTPSGKCVGWVPSGHWIVTGTATEGIRRCRCGCFAENTRFTTPQGEVTAASLVGKADLSTQLLVNDRFDSWGVGFHAIKTVVAGPEKENSYEFHTASGRSIRVSRAHPLVVVDSLGKFQVMKRAEDVTRSDLLLTDDGNPDAILSIDQAPYDGRMVNFDVAADGPEKHVVLANGLRTGDNIWQQNLSNREARLAKREDIFAILNAAAP